MSAGEWQPINDTTGERTIYFNPSYGRTSFAYMQLDDPLPHGDFPSISINSTPSYGELMARVAALEWELAQLKQQLQDDKDQT